MVLPKYNRQFYYQKPTFQNSLFLQLILQTKIKTKQVLKHNSSQQHSNVKDTTEQERNKASKKKK